MKFALLQTFLFFIFLFYELELQKLVKTQKIPPSRNFNKLKRGVWLFRLKGVPQSMSADSQKFMFMIIIVYIINHSKNIISTKK